MILKKSLQGTRPSTSPSESRLPNGLRFCPVARSANGRIKANFILIAGHEEHHPEGSYYIEWWEGRKRLRLSVGKNALAAEAKRHQKEQMMTAKSDGLKAGLKCGRVGPPLTG